LKVRHRFGVQRLKQIGVEVLRIAGTVDRDPPPGGPALLLSKYP